ncbi:MAG: TerC family protein [Pseudomonas sp.]|uniref:TerC family protein n=1 Tax=Pseudomonas abieticivorans TaxID=2931382 RepID=UPI0020BFACB4|nr:TerC family protein [Pseudomonas sp. PIA16]MDE1167743.1 TerC family protein [Pseudomonas sp.]
MHAFFEAIAWSTLPQIVLLDLLLGGDNAIVIALASRNLPAHLRRKAVLLGVAGAVVLRILMLVCAVKLLGLPGLKIVGALLLLWIGIKLLAASDDDAEIDGGATFLSAVRTLIVADAVMSLDNVVAVASAAGGDLFIVSLGVLISIVIIVWGSRLVLAVMERFPWVIVLGAGLLGWVAGGMAVTDRLVAGWLPVAGQVLHYLAAGSGALAVVGVGWLIRRSNRVHFSQ